ncbi:hypothetical protein HYU14_02605 [Candidatus Woesearchaeota archaeon]|nr:hypothetical protein [Candidatus Woesearchaeota archaeon]
MINFKWNVVNSFKKAKRELQELKNNVHGWIISLDGRDKEIEKKIERLEARIERMEEAMMRILTVR